MAGFDWGSLIGGVVDIGGEYLKNEGQKDAAQVQQQAADNSSAVARGIYDQTRADNIEKILAGKAATNQLYSAMQDGTLTRRFTLDDFQADPGYEAALAAGTRMRNQQAAARGAYLDPATNKLLQKYGIDMANQQFSAREGQFNADRTDAYNKIAGIAGFGQTASNASASAAGGYSNTVSAQNTAAAQARAALAQSQAATNANYLSTIGADALSAYNYYNKKKE